MLKPGDKYPVWWYTGETNEHGEHLAQVISIERYKGRYTEYFTHVLRLTAPRCTIRGWLETAVRL